MNYVVGNVKFGPWV